MSFIEGCRDFSDYDIFCRYLSEYLSGYEGDIIILSGHCTGADRMAERYAEEKGYEIEIYPADWKKYGKAAGPKRNMEMVMRADKVVAFWDGVSKGTGNLIESARREGKTVTVFEI